MQDPLVGLFRFFLAEVKVSDSEATALVQNIRSWQTTNFDLVVDEPEDVERAVGRYHSNRRGRKRPRGLEHGAFHAEEGEEEGGAPQPVEEAPELDALPPPSEISGSDGQEPMIAISGSDEEEGSSTTTVATVLEEEEEVKHPDFVCNRFPMRCASRRTGYGTPVGDPGVSPKSVEVWDQRVRGVRQNLVRQWRLLLKNSPSRRRGTGVMNCFRMNHMTVGPFAPLPRRGASRKAQRLYECMKTVPPTSSPSPLSVHGVRERVKFWGDAWDHVMHTIGEERVLGGDATVQLHRLPQVMQIVDKVFWRKEVHRVLSQRRWAL